MEEDILEAGAEIVWVLEYDTGFNAGTAESCRTFVDGNGSNQGWCVGDGQTEPEAGVWDTSPFSVGRGFDIIVDRQTMVIGWESSHGTPSGNENPTGEDVLEQVRAITGR